MTMCCFCYFVDLFSLVADRDNKINDSRLWLLIYEIMQLPRQLGETSATSNSLDPNILTCFKKVRSLIGLQGQFCLALKRYRARFFNLIKSSSSHIQPLLNDQIPRQAKVYCAF